MSDIVKQDSAPMMSEQAHFELVVKQAEVLAKSSIVPKAYRGKSADIIASGLAGRAFNWDVMTSMRNYHVIEGSASLRPEAMLGLVRLHGHSVDFREEPDAVVAIGKRHDTGDVYESRFSVADAESAGLAGKRNWKQYQNAMLTWRAVSKLCRYLFSDVVLGAGYVPEEIGADTDSEGEVIEIEVSEVKEIDPFAPEIMWHTFAEAKTKLLEACDGDKDLAVEIWGDRSTADDMPKEVTDEELQVLIRQATAMAEMKQDFKEQTDGDEVVQEQEEMFK